MNLIHRTIWPIAAMMLVLIAPNIRSARAQFGQIAFGQVPGTKYELSEEISLERADGITRTYLERVKEYLTDSEWEKAVETLREVMENSGDKLLGVTDRRFVSIRDNIHLQLATLPPEALAIYRSRVDPMAQKWYEEGVSRRDRQQLMRVLDEAFASSWGDNGLFALGEIALESGDYASARACWEKILPFESSTDAAVTWLSVPDTELDLAAVRARLVLVSILEGSTDRATEELGHFVRLHPNAEGRLGGRESNFAKTLGELLTASADWPTMSQADDWSTFAGSTDRNGAVGSGVDPAGVSWRLPLRRTIPAHLSIWGSGKPTPRVAEDSATPLSYHPAVIGDLVLVNNQVEIHAINLATGTPAWGLDNPTIYRDAFDETYRVRYAPPENLGVARFTMTVAGGKLYVKMGSSVTCRPQRSKVPSGYLVCLDLATEGRLLWKAMPENRDWSFDGTPLVDGSSVYVAMRQSDIQPRAYVACLEAETGRLRWRRSVCASETPARGMIHETTHNLLTLHRGTLYFNTNQGAIAAVDTANGRLKWVTLYPRQCQGDLYRPPPHTSRDLTPCLLDRGRLLVAPADSPRIFALDAANGQILWQSGTELEDVVHLLGVANNRLIASGDRLYWIGLSGADAGRIKRLWPNGAGKPGYGRGLLADGNVYWPTREKIRIFDQTTAEQKKVVDLAARGLSGGNLLIAKDHLLITTSDELVVLSERTNPASEKTPEVPIAFRLRDDDFPFDRNPL